MFINCFTMPAKRASKAVHEEGDSSYSQDSSNKDKKGFSKKFECSCGKKYSSKHAVYTHIKNKHPESEWEQRRKEIYDPNAVERTNFQIRMTDIDYH